MNGTTAEKHVALYTIGVKVDFRETRAFQNFLVHFAITAVIATLSGGGIDNKIAAYRFGRNFVFHIPALQFKRAMDGVENVTQSECDRGFRWIKLES